MKKALPILRRELFTFLASPMGYIILAAYTFVVAFFFNSFITQMIMIVNRNPAGIRYADLNFVSFMFQAVMIVLFFIAPALTMRTIAEEKSTGTIQLLLTAPVRDSEVIAGKFGAAFVFFLTIIAASVVFPVILAISATSLNWAEVLAAYVGLVLLAALFCACGVFISSLVESQIVAAVLTFASLVFFNWIVGFSGGMFPGRIGEVLSYFSFINHFRPFLEGVISTRDIIFFLSTILLFLFLSVKSLEKRKWSNLLEDDASRDLFRFDIFWTGALFLWGLFALLIFIMPAYDLISMTIFIAGCLLAAIWVIRRRTILNLVFRSNKGMAGANVLISGVLVLAVYGIVNIANQRFYHAWDMTFDKLKSLAPETERVIAGLDADAEIVMFESRHRAPDLLDRYARYSSKISIRYLDPVYYRAAVEEISREVSQVQLADYLLVRDIRKPYAAAHLINLKAIRPDDQNRLEEEIDLKLLAIGHAARDQVRKKVYFLTGHGESRISDTGGTGLSQLAMLLEKEFIEYADLFLPGTMKIPGDCDLLVIAGPTHRTREDSGLLETSFAPEELRILADYLARERGNLLVFAGPEFSRVPFGMVEAIIRSNEGWGDAAPFAAAGGLVALLAREGFLLTDGILFHDRYHLSGDNAALVTEPRKGNDITQQKNYTVITPYATPLQIARDPQLSTLTFAAPGVWMESFTTSDRVFDPDKEVKYRQVVTAAYRHERSEQGLNDRRLAVIGSSRLPSNQYLSMQNNRELVRDTVNWLLNKENFSITRNYTKVMITISDTAKDAIFYVSVVVIPFMFLGVAVLVWWDRR